MDNLKMNILGFIFNFEKAEFLEFDLSEFFVFFLYMIVFVNFSITKAIFFRNRIITLKKYAILIFFVSLFNSLFLSIIIVLLRKYDISQSIIYVTIASVLVLIFSSLNAYFNYQINFILRKNKIIEFKSFIKNSFFVTKFVLLCSIPFLLIMIFLCKGFYGIAQYVIFTLIFLSAYYYCYYEEYKRYHKEIKKTQK